MYNVRVRTMQILAFAAAIGLAVPSMFAQAKRPPSQTAVQPQQINQQQNSNQTQASPAQSSVCANRPLCYEGNDFVATVTEFRTSTDPRGIRIIDAMMHFQNKTNQQISLGYVDGSGSAIDDMGNRLGLNTYNGGVRGMGIVAGNNVDPKFSLPPGGGGDARFELYWVPGGKLSGVNYEMELSIREMNRVEGNQWTLGDETLLHYQGLANGMGVAPLSNVNSAGMGSGTGAVANVGSNVNAFTPGQANASMPSGQTMMTASGQPCPPGATTSGTLTNVANSAGAQNGTANNTVTNASAAISNLGSIFARKKKPATAPATANASAPCTPAVNANTKANAMGTTVANTAVTQPANGIPAANTNGTIQTTTTTTTTTTTPAARGAVTTAVTRRPVATTSTQPTAAAAVTKTSLKQPVPATTKTAAPAAKKPAQTPATTTTAGTGGSK